MKMIITVERFVQTVKVDVPIVPKEQPDEDKVIKAAIEALGWDNDKNYIDTDDDGRITIFNQWDGNEPMPNDCKYASLSFSLTVDDYATKTSH